MSIILLGVYLIIVGAVTLFGIAVGAKILALLALIVGILLLAESVAPAGWRWPR